MATQITLRKDTADNWANNDPTLAAGEIGIAIDTSDSDGQPIQGIKIGDGSSTWTALGYAFPVFNHVNKVVDTSTKTLYLKGLVSQTGEILKIENSDGEELIGVTQDPSSPIIKFLGAGVGSIQISGGYSADSTARGTTIDVNGGIETNEAIEIGEYADDGSSGGVKIYHDQIGTDTEPDHGILKIAATSDADDADDCIIVHKGSDAKFVVEANGDVECNTVTAATTVTCQGIVNSEAVINAGTQKVTGVVDPTDAQDAATKAYVDGYPKSGHAHFTVTLNETSCTSLINAVTVGRINTVTLSASQITIDLEADMSGTDYVTIITGHAVDTADHSHPMTFEPTGSVNGLTAKTTEHFKFKPRKYGTGAYPFVIMVSVYEA